MHGLPQIQQMNDRADADQDERAAAALERALEVAEAYFERSLALPSPEAEECYFGHGDFMDLAREIATALVPPSGVTAEFEEVAS
jgi:hypothetical protein